MNKSVPTPVDLSYSPTSIMEAIGVFMTYPMSSYLEQELDKRFNLFRLWNLPQKNDFFKENFGSIRAVVGNANADKVDLGHYKQKGIRVTNTPDVLTEDVADLAIGLMLATLREICECDRYVRAGLWKKVSSCLFLLSECFGSEDFPNSMNGGFSDLVAGLRQQSLMVMVV
ncbi:unnamed protein product [Lactuca saligna]|uniref:D-isomer specific 2-hydroxyacid dehydrogenase catalytic domain-containing protein n=1 Tax=Lactuca saligna TaxID=75948 RepID=A0AA35YH76_LACSI|nr:unnamed protein product [Lactuca saligna]